jgi:N-acetylneuraminic acid mutarotase
MISTKKMTLKKGTVNYLILIIATLTLISCNPNDDTEDDDLGNWLTSSTFDGIARSSASSFVIGNKGYVGTGYDGDNYLNDFWEFNIEGGFWVQKANFPGSKRSATSSFTVGNYGYLGVGYDGTDEKNDFYKYDPVSNTWQQIANFGGNLRRGAVSFSSNSNGFVGCGYDGTNDKKDFWKYDPITNTWLELFGFGGNKRKDGITFRIDNKVYMGTGKSNGIELKDFWSFDLTSETWTKLRDISINDDDDNTDEYSILRSNSVGFSIGKLGYITTGTAFGTTWEYNPNTDYWTRKTSLEASSRQDAVAISNGQRAFVLLGRSGNSYFDDMYEFKPQDEQIDDD